MSLIESIRVPSRSKSMACNDDMTVKLVSAGPGQHLGDVSLRRLLHVQPVSCCHAEQNQPGEPHLDRVPWKWRAGQRGKCGMEFCLGGFCQPFDQCGLTRSMSSSY